MGDSIVYYVRTHDDNIGNIYTLLGAQTAYGEEELKQMTLREFLGTNWSGNLEERPCEGDLHGILTELVDRYEEFYG